jgi:hypothetical protein
MSSQWPIELNYNEYSKIDGETLNSHLQHVNDLYAALPKLTAPQVDENSRPVLTIITGEFWDDSEQGKLQSKADGQQIREYLMKYFPSSEINIVLAEKSTYGTIQGGVFTVPSGTLGFQFTVKINRYGF